MGRERFVLEIIRDAVGRDVFGLIRQRLNYFDLEIIYAAHGSNGWRRFTSIEFYYVKNGNLEMIQWFHKEQAPDLNRIPEYAVYFEQIHILKWCESESSIPFNIRKLLLQALDGVPRGKVLNWMKVEKIPLYEQWITISSICGHEEAKKWLETGELLPNLR